MMFDLVYCCPICKSTKYKYEYATTEFWGAMVTAEQSGYCSDCGYWIEQHYSPACEGFADIKRGYRDSNGVYHSKNVRKHKRNRRKHLDKVKQIDMRYNYLYYYL